MAGINRSAQAKWSGPVGSGQGTISGESGAFTDLRYTFASRSADASSLTDPEELLASAHAGCFAMALSNELTTAGLPPASLTVRATVTLAPTSRGRRITKSELTIEGTFDEAVEQARFAEFVESADQRCPFSALIRTEGEVLVAKAIVV
ncbi:OsmC family peroxiredoxin [Amycolatopsis lurida]